MTYLRKHDVRTLADRVVGAYKERTHITADIYAVNIESLAELFGFEVIKIKFGEDSDLLGFTAFRYQRTIVTDEEGNEIPLYLSTKSIVVNESLKESCIGRYNFTIAHEVAHQVINKAYGLNYQQKYRMTPHYYYRKRNAVYDADEVLANQLASFILMPAKPIRIAFRKAFERSRIEIISPDMNRDHYRHFVSIAKLFGVSKEALKIRLQQLGMLGEFRDNYYNTTIDVFPEEKTA